MSRPSSNDQPVWCILHKDGWCAHLVDLEPPAGMENVPTRCNHFVILPLGVEKRVPTCKDCLSVADSGSPWREPPSNADAVEIRLTWDAAKCAGCGTAAYRILERMVDRLGYGRRGPDNPPLAPGVPEPPGADGRFTSDDVIFRLRHICGPAYKAKHGRELTTERGWCLEMVSFIHGVLSNLPENATVSTKEER